jgi:hypothetical protein
MSIAVLKNTGLVGQSISANANIGAAAYNSTWGIGDFSGGGLHGLADGKLAAPKNGDYRLHFSTRLIASTGDEEQTSIEVVKNGVNLGPAYIYRNAGSLIPGACQPATIRSSQTTHPLTGTGNGNPTPNVALPAAPTPGNLQVVFTSNDTPATNSIFGVNQVGTTSLAFTGMAGTPIQVAPTQQNFRWGMYYRFAKPGDTAALNFNTTGSAGRKSFLYLEYTGVDTFDSVATVSLTVNNPNPLNFGPLTPIAVGSAGLIVGGANPANNVNDTWSATSDQPASFIEDFDFGPVAGILYMWAGHIVVNSFSGSYNGSITTIHGGITRGYGTWFAAFSCTAPPSIGRPDTISAEAIIPNLTAGDLIQLRANVSGAVGETWNIVGTEFGLELMQDSR